MKKYLLFLQPDRISCYSKSGAEYFVIKEWAISANELPSDFSEYLRSCRYTEFTLLFDLPEEECHLHDLKARGLSDRRHIIEKLKSRRFESSLLSLAKISKFRENVSVLLTGVDNNKLCENLIKALGKSGVSLKAIHSATTLTPVLAKRISAKKGAQLFVFTFSGCYRLVACMDSSVLFTRRVALSGKSESLTDDYALLHKSVNETLSYVQRLHDGWVPSVVLIGSLGSAEQLQVLQRSSLTSSKVSEIRNHLPAGIVSGNPGIETLLMQSASRSGYGYASQQHRKNYISHKVQNVCAALALFGVGGVISSVAVAEKINRAHEIITDNYSQSEAGFTRDIAVIESQYDHPVEAVRQALVTARLLEFSFVQDPVEFLSSIGPAVQESDVAVTSVSWEAEELVSKTLLDSQFGEAISLESAPVEVLPIEQIYKATLAGVVTGKPDEALDKFELFVSVLRDISSDPSVVVVETPFGLGNQHKTSSADYSADQAEFVVEISNQSIEQ